MGMLIAKIIAVLAILEVGTMFAVKKLRKNFQWLITSEDECPRMDNEGLEKFIKHGFDPELGWIRKPNTWHPERGKYGETSYHINEFGARCHPRLEHLPMRIACFGDSFTFSRQVNDDETWPWQVSSMSNAGVWNFGVGNYGIDQACLRMERELEKIGPEIVIMGVVPSTIVRILCVWKHYNEFGNTFGFKPRFNIKDGKLTLVKNIVDDESKFHEFDSFSNKIKDNDYFYRTKFRDEMIKFPYLYSTFRKPMRNVPIMSALALRGMGIKSKRLEEYPMMKIMDINKVLRLRLFRDEGVTRLFEMIIDRFIRKVKEAGAKPVFLFMPQKDDVLLIKEKGPYYADFINKIRENVLTIDMTETLLSRNDLDDIYSDDNVYGGHFSRDGNKFVGEIVYSTLKDNKYL